jgi:hypothetical protein
MTLLLIVPIIFLAIGIFLIIKPHSIANWLRSFARPIAGDPNAGLISPNAQDEQATSRPIFIRILGVVFLCVGILGILRVF